MILKTAGGASLCSLDTFPHFSAGSFLPGRCGGKSGGLRRGFGDSSPFLAMLEDSFRRLPNPGHDWAIRSSFVTVRILLGGGFFYLAAKQRWEKRRKTKYGGMWKVEDGGREGSREGDELIKRRKY